jgi:hypothetical protein
VLNTEVQSTIATFSSKSKVDSGHFPNSITNDVEVPRAATLKLPNSELLFQNSKQPFDLVADVQFVIRHPISQNGTVAMMKEAHASKSIEPTEMAT